MRAGRSWEGVVSLWIVLPRREGGAHVTIHVMLPQARDGLRFQIEAGRLPLCRDAVDTTLVSPIALTGALRGASQKERFDPEFWGPHARARFGGLGRRSEAGGLRRCHSSACRVLQRRVEQAWRGLALLAGFSRPPCWK